MRALTINYAATQASLESKERKKISAWDDKLVAGQVSQQLYVQQKDAIEVKYAPQ